jgi:hypothetical protein
MACPGSVALEAPFPDTSSAYAAEGTVAHALAALRLTDYRSNPVLFGVEQLSQTYIEDGFSITVDEDMIAHVEDYAHLVLKYAEGGQLLVEQRVDFSPVIGVPDSFGTSDAVIIKGDELIVIDLKYGRGVQVDAADNEQLQLYALGALNDYDMLSDFSMVTMVIHQPRLNHVSEWSVPVQDLRIFGRKAAEAADNALAIGEPMYFAPGDLVPGEKQCRWCKAKAVCPALKAEVQASTALAASPDDFRDLHDVPSDNLGAAMDRVALVEGWCLAIRAEVERRLFAGGSVEGYKLVEGRRGNRSWVAEKDVEALFKSFRLKQDEMYDLKLISPTKAEKLIKDKSPKRWAKVEGLISRSDGKPSVAPVTDKRPALAITSVADDFRDRDE